MYVVILLYVNVGHNKTTGIDVCHITRLTYTWDAPFQQDLYTYNVYNNPKVTPRVYRYVADQPSRINIKQTCVCYWVEIVGNVHTRMYVLQHCVTLLQTYARNQLGLCITLRNSNMY